MAGQQMCTSPEEAGASQECSHLKASLGWSISKWLALRAGMRVLAGAGGAGRLAVALHMGLSFTGLLSIL